MHKNVYLIVGLVAAGLLVAGTVVAQFTPNIIFLPVILKPEDTPTGTPTQTLAPGPTPKNTPIPTQPPANCSPAYPTVCIPPPPPDLDCSDIIYRRFQVLPPDPHGFDSDHDGIGCES